MELIKNSAMTKTSSRCGLFIPEDVRNAFNAELLDENLCRDLILGMLFPKYKLCPGCEVNIPWERLHSFWMGKRIKCWNCGKYFTALTGTFLSGCHFNFGEIVLLGFMLALNVPDKQIAETLKMSVENVRLWRHRFEAIEQSKKIGSGE